MRKNFFLAVGLILLIVVWRVLTQFETHMWNIAPTAAAALLAGAVMPRKWALSVPILGTLFSDIIIGFYHVPVMLTVYGCFAIAALLGSWIAPRSDSHSESTTGVRKINSLKVLGVSLTSSVVFFIATNFVVWASAEWYEKSWQGLALCYTLAIPFFRNTMLGDLMFTGVVFGAWVCVNKVLALRSKQVQILQLINSYVQRIQS